MSKSASLRRIKADIRELANDPSDQYYAAPLENDMFEWHFTIRGAQDTDFAGGVYHGRILLPPEYPFKPPNIVFLTPSGRFECGVKVCLSFSAHHPELWQPAWGIRLILEAIISFLPTPADGALGALDWTSMERKKLAKESVNFRCVTCCAKGETCASLLPKIHPRDNDISSGRTTSKFHEECEKLKLLQYQNHAFGEDKITVINEIATKRQSDSINVVAPEHGEQTQASLPPDVATTTESTLASIVHTIETDNKDAVVSSQLENTKTIVDEKLERNGKENPEISQQFMISQTPNHVNSLPTAPAPAVANATDHVNNDNPIVSDNILHGMIGFFAIIVIFLLRQAQSLVDELLDLEEGSDDGATA